MRYSLLTAGLSLGGLLLVAAAELAQTPGQDGDPSLAPYVVWIGPDSRIAARDILRIDTSSAWTELWERHTGEPLRRGNAVQPFGPSVDFNRCTVLAVFAGDSWNSNGYFVHGVQDVGEAVRVRVDQYTYQTAGGADGGRVGVRPFGIFVLPKTAKPILIEENTQGLIGGPPEWTPRVQLPAAP